MFRTITAALLTLSLLCALIPITTFANTPLTLGAAQLPPPPPPLPAAPAGGQMTTVAPALLADLAPLPNLPSNYSVQLQISSLNDQISNLRTLLSRPNISLTITPDQQAALLQSVQSLEAAVTALIEGPLSDLVTMEIRIDQMPRPLPGVANGLAVARWIDDRGATRTASFILPYTLATSSSNQLDLIRSDVVEQAAELSINSTNQNYLSSFDALLRGAVIVNTFTPGWNHFFRTASSTPELESQTDEANELDSPIAISGRSNLERVLVAGDIRTERFRIEITYGNERTATGTLLATTTQTFNYDLTLRDARYSDYIIDRAEDYRDQLVEEAAELTNRSPEEVEEKLSTSFRLFRDGADAARRIDFTRRPDFEIPTSTTLLTADLDFSANEVDEVINTFQVLGNFSQINAIGVLPGSYEDASWFARNRTILNIALRSDQGEDLALEIRPVWDDGDDDDQPFLDYYQVTLNYQILGTNVVTLQGTIEPSRIDRTMRDSFDQIASGAGAHFGVSDAQLSSDLRNFLVRNTNIFSTRSLVTGPVQCNSPSEIMHIMRVLDYYLGSLNTVDKIEHITSLGTRVDEYTIYTTDNDGDSDVNFIPGCIGRPAGGATIFFPNLNRAMPL